MEFTDQNDRTLAFDETFAPRHEVHRGVHFRMVDTNTGERLPCLVSTEALHDRAGARGMPEDDVLATFIAFRSEIEGIALNKFANGNKFPIVKTADLN